MCCTKPVHFLPLRRRAIGLHTGGGFSFSSCSFHSFHWTFICVSGCTEAHAPTSLIPPDHAGAESSVMWQQILTSYCPCQSGCTVKEQPSCVSLVSHCSSHWDKEKGLLQQLHWKSSQRWVTSPWVPPPEAPYGLIQLSICGVLAAVQEAELLFTCVFLDLQFCPLPT